MRSSANEATIGVSCGHRVPRLPVAAARGNVYWCEACGEHRMSDNSSTGERAFEFLLQLRDDIATHEIPIVVPDPGTDRGRAIVAALGASIDPRTIVEVDEAQQFFLAATERMRRVEQGERVPDFIA